MTDFAEVKISQFSPVPVKPVSKTINLKKSLHAAPTSPIVLPRHGGVALLGERLTGSQEVRGSIPLVSTIVMQRPSGNRRSFLYEKTADKSVSLTNASTRKKVAQYPASSVHSLLAKHNTMCNSRRQLCNSGSSHQPTHPHKPAATLTILHYNAHKHVK